MGVTSVIKAYRVSIHARVSVRQFAGVGQATISSFNSRTRERATQYSPQLSVIVNSFNSRTRERATDKLITAIDAYAVSIHARVSVRLSLRV